MNYLKYIQFSLMLLTIISCSNESSNDAALFSTHKEASVESEQRKSDLSTLYRTLTYETFFIFS